MVGILFSYTFLQVQPVSEEKIRELCSQNLRTRGQERENEER